MNEPDREGAVVLDGAEKKVYVAKENKLLNTLEFTLIKEDHTVGNLLRMSLLGYRHVRFAGYKMPHPLEYVVIVKVQTTPEITPMDAMQTSIRDLIQEFDNMENTFKSALERFRRSALDMRT